MVENETKAVKRKEINAKNDIHVDSQSPIDIPNVESVI